MKIYLIRHSESEDDLINCYGGAADWDLTKEGALKVENFRPTCEKFRIERFYSSPLKRAYKSAEILNAKKKIPLEIIFDLHETNHYGYLTGLEKNLAKELFAYLLEKPEFQNASYYNRKCMPGGESTEDLDKRTSKVMKEILNKSKGLKAIGILTHGGVLRSIFWSVLKDKRKIIEINDVAYAEVHFENGEFNLIKTEGFKFE